MTAPRPEALLALLVELDRVRAVVLDVLEHTAPPVLPVPQHDGEDDPQPLHELLVGVRRTVLGHPVAAKRLYDLIVAEGHRYAETAHGARLRDALAASEAVANLRRIWETVSLNVLDGPAAPSGVPDAWAEALSDAITGRVLDDTVLAKLRPDGFT
jgi:hypothetical protein